LIRTHTPLPKQTLTGLGFVLLGALGFSAKAIFIKLAYAASPEVDALTLMTLRMLFSLPWFLAVLIWQQTKTTALPLNLRQYLMVLGLGLIGYYVASYLDFLGLKYISAGLERVILFSYPTFVVLFSALLFKRKIRAALWLALLLSYVGMLLVFYDNLNFAASGLVTGSALVLASAVVFSFFIMGSGVMIGHLGSARFTAYTMTVASLATLAHFAVLHPVDITGFPVNVYFLALMMALFSTVLPAFFMNAGIRRIGSSPAAIISTTGPIATLALAYTFLDEPITAFQLLGTLFVLAGVYLVSRCKN